MTRAFKAQPALSFFVLAYLIAFACVGLAAVGPAPLAPALLVGSYAPALAAALVVAVTGGRAALRGWAAGLTRLRVALAWWLVALSPLAIVALAVVVDRLVLGGGPGTPALAPSPPALLGALGVALVFGALGEEPGWRGFAQPRVQGRLPALGAALLVGLVWAGWHAPLWFIPDSPQYGIPFLGWLPLILASAVLLAWLINHCGGSVLPAIVFHAAFNFAGSLAIGLGFIPLERYFIVAPVLYVGYAAAVALLTDPATLTRRPIGGLSTPSGEARQGGRVGAGG
jgi:membrane protease YdiL (CAAX protease family)